MRRFISLASALLLVLAFSVPAAANAGGTVTICHIPAGNLDAARTLTVHVNAVAAHLRHGDTLGTCPG